MRAKSRILFVLCLAGSFLPASLAGAVTYQWSGGSGDWQTVGNWTPTAPAFSNEATGNTSLFSVSVNSPTTTGSVIFANPLTIDTGGTLNVTASRTISYLHLAGGTLQQSGSATGQSGLLFAEAATTSSINNTLAAGSLFTLGTQFNGSGTLAINNNNAGAIVRLSNPTISGSYTGTIDINSGILRMGNANGLSGGTVQADNGATGLFQIGAGFSTGRVNVLSGGIAEADTNGTIVSNLHLATGSTLRGGTLQVGNGGSNGSRIYVDGAGATIQTTSAGQNLTVAAQLNGSAALNLAGGGTISLSNDIRGDTYSGAITVASGTTLLMANALGLSGGTVNVTGAGGTFQVGAGITSGQVNVQSGAVALNTVNGSSVNNLHLQGGSLRGSTGLQFGNGGSVGDKLFVDSASTLYNTGAAASSFGVAAQLHGAGDFIIDGANANTVTLLNNSPGTPYSGTITIASGRTLVLGNAQALSGGTVNLTTGSGIFALGTGFATGQVHVQSGGTLLANGTTNLSAVGIHLNGGTLQSNAAASVVGDNTTGSNLFVDNASTLDSNGQTMNIRGRLSGSGNLTKVNSGTTVLAIDNSATFNGNVAVSTGTLQLASNGALGSGSNQLTIADGGAQVNITAAMTNSVVNMNKLTLGTHTFTFGGPGTQSFSTASGSVLDDALVSVNIAPYFTGTAKTINLVSAAPASYTVTPSSTDWTATANWFDGTANPANFANYAGKNFIVGSGKVAQTTSSTIFHDQLTIQTGGRLELNNGRIADNLHLAGGELRGTVNGALLNGQIFADAATSSTIANNAGAGTTMSLSAQLNGSGTLVVNSSDASAIVLLTNAAVATTFSGLIDLDQGVLELGGTRALAGGTVQVDNTNATFRLGSGFTTGRVNVLNNGVAQATNGAAAIVNDLHLAGGRLESSVNNSHAGDGGGVNIHSNRITVDSASTLRNAGTAGSNFFISSQLIGSGNLTVDNTLASSLVQLNGAGLNSSYSGTITINNGILRMNNSAGLSGGTVQVNNANGLFRLGNGFATGRVNVAANGIAETDSATPAIASNLHLMGGSLRGVVNSAVFGDNSNASNIYVDNDSFLTSSALSAGNAWRMQSRLNGAGKLTVDLNLSTALLQLEHQYLSSTYTGTIDIDTGIVRMNHANGLSGGTIQVDNGSTGIFRLGEGFANGRVNVLTGGIAEADNTNGRVASNLHLMGGTLRNNTTSSTIVGDNTTASRITVDSDSTLSSSAASGSLQIQSQIFGTGKLTINNTAGLQVYLTTNGADLQNTVSYSGDWDVQSGTLRLGNGGNGNANALLGSGALLNIASGQQVLLDDIGSNAWDIRQTLTGSGTLNRTGTSDTVFIRRNNDNSAGGISPGNSAGVFNVNAPITFAASSVGGYLPQLAIEVTGGGAVAGTDFDRLNVTTTATNPITNISLANLLVNISNVLTQADLSGDKLAFLTNPLGTGRNFNTYGQTFNSTTLSNPHWTASVVYGDASQSPFGNNAVYLQNFLFTNTTAYWDVNGDTAQSGNTNPAGNWGFSDSNWGFNVAGTTSTLGWTNGDDAVFSAGGDATGVFNVTITSPVIAHNITVDEGIPTIGSGTLTLAGVTPTITVNSAQANINSIIAGVDGLTKAGAGTLSLGGFNSYGGATDIATGTLLQNGNHTGGGAYTVASGATFGGSGSTDSLLTGGGLVSPGNSQGIVTVGQLDPSGAMAFGFVLTSAGDPLWSNSGASLNDVLRMTNETTPFTSPLALSNAVDIYFGVATLLGGEIFRGGFYTDSNGDFLTSIDSGTYNYWVLGDGAGSDTTFEGQGYYSLSSYNANYYVVLSTVQVPTADFTSGDVNNGWVTQFSVQDVSAVPEPSALALGLLSLLSMAKWGWRRRHSRK